MEGRVDHASIEVQSIILSAIGGFRAHRVLTRREASSRVLAGTICNPRLRHASLKVDNGDLGAYKHATTLVRDATVDAPKSES